MDYVYVVIGWDAQLDVLQVRGVFAEELSARIAAQRIAGFEQDAPDAWWNDYPGPQYGGSGIHVVRAPYGRTEMPIA